jgi:hypothetical protein
MSGIAGMDCSNAIVVSFRPGQPVCGIRLGAGLANVEHHHWFMLRDSVGTSCAESTATLGHRAFVAPGQCGFPSMTYGG